MVKYAWNIRNRLNRKKKICSVFSIFIFRVMVIFRHFCSKNCQFSMNFHDNYKNKERKNRKTVFSFVPAHCASFMKVGSKLREGGLLVVTWDRASIWNYIYIYKWKYIYNSRSITPGCALWAMPSNRELLLGEANHVIHVGQSELLFTKINEGRTAYLKIFKKLWRIKL